MTKAGIVVRLCVYVLINYQYRFKNGKRKQKVAGIISLVYTEHSFLPDFLNRSAHKLKE